MTRSEQHRQRQLALRAVTLRQVLSIWPAFDIDDIDGSWPAVQAALSALIWLRHRDSANIAAGYYRLARLAAGVAGPAPVVLAPPPPAEQLDISLRVVGLLGAKKLVAAGARDPNAVTLTKVAGTVGRLALDGGRQTLVESTKADRRAKGWTRVTSAKPCEFCSLLASRGAVYGEDTAGFEAHDHCSCTAEPVFA